MNKYNHFLLLILSSFLLTGCATHYRHHGFGGGYSEIALSTDIFKVSFRGNGFTSEDTVQNLLLRRCADITLREGHKYFVIVGGNTRVNENFFTTPTTINSNSYGTFQGRGYSYTPNSFAYSGEGYGSTQTTIRPGSNIRINKYASTVIIRLLKSNKNVPLAFNAQIILNNYIRR